jgi:hypothetical protein
VINESKLVHKHVTCDNCGKKNIEGVRYKCAVCADFDLCENINKIDAYINSRHVSGKTDSMGREKPFFNIVI